MTQMRDNVQLIDMHTISKNDVTADIHTTTTEAASTRRREPNTRRRWFVDCNGASPMDVKTPLLEAMRQGTTPPDAMHTMAKSRHGGEFPTFGAALKANSCLQPSSSYLCEPLVRWTTRYNNLQSSDRPKLEILTMRVLSLHLPTNSKSKHAHVRHRSSSNTERHPARNRPS